MQGARWPLKGKCLENTMPSLGKENYRVYVFLVPETKGKSAEERELFVRPVSSDDSGSSSPDPAKSYGGSLILNEVMIITTDKK